MKSPGFQVTQDLVMLLLSLPTPFLLSILNVCIVGITTCLGRNEVLVVFVIYCFALLVSKAVPQSDQHLITLVTQVTYVQVGSARCTAASAEWSICKGKVAVVLVWSLIWTPWPCNTRRTQTLVFCHSPEHSL